MQKLDFYANNHCFNSIKGVACSLALAVLGASSHAATLTGEQISGDSCQQQRDTMSVEYRVDRLSPYKKSTSKLGLWRYQGRVAQVSPEKGIASVWFKNHKNQIKLDRLFDQFSRGIEYQSSDYRGDIGSWDKKYQLIPTELVSMLKVESSTGSGCDLLEYRTGEINGETHKLYWMPNLRLVKLHIMKSKRSQVNVSLTELSQDEAKIKTQFEKWDSYDLTDYADVGDNESDPFLAKMINMGFVKHGAGFYNSDGTAIVGGAHNHYHGY